jgi:lysophospholipase L1-like esterase
VYRILCLGGSTMYDSEIEPNHETFALQLEQRLHGAGYSRVEVVNGAVSGYQSIESLIHLQLRLLDLEPDMLLVYDNFNDILARLVWPQSAYQGDGSGHTEAAAVHIARWTWQEDINLVRIARRLLDPPSAAKAMLKFMACFPDTALTAEFVTQLGHDSYPSGIFSTLDLDAVLDANPPRYFERNTRNLIHTARGNGIVPVFHTFRLCEAKQDIFSHPIFRRGVREHNAVLRQVCRELGAPLFDFEAAFPDDPALYADGIHHNAAGAARRAEIVAEHLVGTLFPSLPGAPRAEAAGL